MCFVLDNNQDWLKKEEKRLNALHEYEIDYFVPDPVLNSITELLSIICKTKLALVNILERETVYIKSTNKKVYDETFQRKISFCKWANEQDDLFEIPNTLDDLRFKDNPFSLCNPPVIYYAGMPLKTRSGYNIGVLCAIDDKPHKMNEEQILAIKTLANLVINQFELNKSNKQLKISNEKTIKLAKVKEDFLSNISHEIRTPLNSIYGFSNILVNTNLDNNQFEMLNIVRSSIEILMGIINDILDFSKIESGKLAIENYLFYLQEMFLNIKQLFSQKQEKKI